MLRPPHIDVAVDTRPGARLASGPSLQQPWAVLALDRLADGIHQRVLSERSQCGHERASHERYRSGSESAPWWRSWTPTDPGKKATPKA